MMSQERQNVNLAIQSASAGLASQGVYICDQGEEVMSPRCNLIKVKDSIRRVQPHDGGLDIQEEFTLKHNEKNFIKLVEKFGYKHIFNLDGNLSFDGKLNASAVRKKSKIEIISALFLPKIEINIGGKFSRASETHHESETSNSLEAKFKYYSKVHLAIIPVDACTLKESNIQLDDGALDELKKIDRLLSNRDANDPEISQACKNFFQKYGSHALLGTITFGGIYVFSSSTQDFVGKDENEVKRIVNKKLDQTLSLRGSYDTESDSKTTVEEKQDDSENKMEANRTKKRSTQANLNGSGKDWFENQNQSESSEIVKKITVRLETRTIGGNSLDGDNLQAWKNTLRDPQNLAVINRDMKPIAIWKLIVYNHSTEFENSFQLVKQLYQEWRQVSGCYEQFDDRDAIHGFRDALQYKISSWIEKGDFTTQPLKILEEMRQQIENGNFKKKHWAQDFLSDPKLQEYLLQYIRVNEGQDRESRHWMKRLLTPQDAGDIKEGVHEKLKDVFSWQKDKPPFLSIGESFHPVKEFVDWFSKIVKRVTQGTSNPEKEEPYLEQRITRLRYSLKDPMSELYLSVLLFPFDYDPVKNIFKKSLKQEDYQKLGNLIEESSKNPLGIEAKESSVEKKEAHLLLKLIENIEVGEEDRADTFIKKTIKGKIESKSASRIIKKLDVKLLSERQNAIQELNDIIQDKPRIEQKTSGVRLEDVLKNSLEYLPKDKPPNAHSEPSPELKEMLNYLGLSQCYPEKLGRQEIYQVTEASMKEDILTKPEQLTQDFIAKLLSFNYEARQLKMTIEKDKHKDNSEVEDWL